MEQDKRKTALGAVLLGAFAAFWRWHSPRAKPLTNEEIDHYLGIISDPPLYGDETEATVAALRRWAEADDGKAAYMLNLIRYFPELRRSPGAPEFAGTPQEANAYYEKSLMSLWVRNASYPMLGGAVQGSNLMTTRPAVEDWSTAQMVRYRSRRTFLQLQCHPSYRPVEPYKFMALEIDLVPVSGDTVIPDARWLVGGGLLALFLAAGWRGAAQRHERAR